MSVLDLLRHVCHCIYIDDIVCSVSTDNKAICLHNEQADLLKKGGFTIHKIASNDQTVMSQIPTDIRETPVLYPSSQLNVSSC